MGTKPQIRLLQITISWYLLETFWNCITLTADSWHTNACTKRQKDCHHWWVNGNFQSIQPEHQIMHKHSFVHHQSCWQLVSVKCAHVPEYKNSDGHATILTWLRFCDYVGELKKLVRSWLCVCVWMCTAWETRTCITRCRPKWSAWCCTCERVTVQDGLRLQRSAGLDIMNLDISTHTLIA